MVDRGSKSENGATARLRQRYPTIDDLRRKARRRVPRFGFDFVDGGATEEYCIDRNTDAFQAVELLPHYCVDGKVTTDTEVFGRKYAAPIGVAPMGSAGLMWPGAEKLFAAEAQKNKIPYVLATPGNASIEEIAKIAPDVFWFQLYRFPYDGLGVDEADHVGQCVVQKVRLDLRFEELELRDTDLFLGRFDARPFALELRLRLRLPLARKKDGRHGCRDNQAQQQNGHRALRREDRGHKLRPVEQCRAKRVAGEDADDGHE